MDISVHGGDWAVNHIHTLIAFDDDVHRLVDEQRSRHVRHASRYDSGVAKDAAMAETHRREVVNGLTDTT